MRKSRGHPSEKRLGTTSLPGISSSLEEKKKQRNGEKFNYTATINTSSYALHALSTCIRYIYIMHTSYHVRSMWDAPALDGSSYRTGCMPTLPTLPTLPTPPTLQVQDPLPGSWIRRMRLGSPAFGVLYDDGTGRRTGPASFPGGMPSLRTARSIPDGTVLAPYRRQVFRSLVRCIRPAFSTPCPADRRTMGGLNMRGMRDASFDHRSPHRLRLIVPRFAHCAMRHRMECTVHTGRCRTVLHMHDGIRPFGLPDGAPHDANESW